MYTSQKLSLGMRNTWLKALGCGVVASCGSGPLKNVRFHYSGSAPRLTDKYFLKKSTPKNIPLIEVDFLIKIYNFC